MVKPKKSMNVNHAKGVHIKANAVPRPQVTEQFV